MHAGLRSLRRARDFLHEEYRLALRHEHWHVGVVDAPIHAFLESDARLDVRWFPMPERGRYLADPFAPPNRRGTEVLFEEFDFRSDRGSIAWADVGEGGRISRPVPAFRTPVHASYPFLVERGGSVYCIPETAEGREVALYRASEFPTHWTREAVLLPGVPGVDNTVFQHEGRFWLAQTDADDGPYSKLRLWHAPDLFGPWTPHAANPVKTDLGSARPAGTPFVADGALYRPGQDSTRGYGGAVALNRVVRLTPTEYREERVKTIAPFWDGVHRHGIHTLSSFGGRTLVDGKRFACNRWALGRDLREAVGRWSRVLRGRRSRTSDGGLRSTA